MRVDVYTHQDGYVGTIGADALLAMSHTDELNGEDSLAITTTFPLCQGYRLVWADRLGKVHEHVCQDPKGLHADGATLYTDTALSSVCELFDDYIEDRRPYSYSFLKALQTALEPTRWEVGTVDQPGNVASGLTFYHTSVRAALNSVLECGGELETEIEVAGGKVSARRIGIRQHRGTSAGHRRFAYTKDLVSIARTEHWGAITACYGYGKGVETDSGGYGRKLTFGDINDGRNYVEDAAALKAHGRPDGKGGFAHLFGEYENSECEDASQLLAETRAYLDEHKEPGVTYEADVVDLVQFGRSWEGVAVGDDVQIVDADYSPELRCQGRVTKLVTDLLGGAQTVTLGNVTETMADLWQQQQQAVGSLTRRSSSWDVAASTPAAYLQQVVDGLNAQFNTQGNSYCFTSFEQGTIWASVPLDEDGRATKSGGSAIQICSQGFRIASGTKADGSWDWRTFGTGEGFTADMITTGSLLASLITAGILQDKTGKNFWNLDTGDFRLSAGATVDGKAIATADATISGVDVEYAQGSSATVAPASGWQTAAPAYKKGWYIWSRTKTTMQDGTSTYSAAVMISGRDGVDGASPTATVVKSGTTSTITITNPDGTKYTAAVEDGTNGTKGDNGYVHVKYSDDGGKTFTDGSGETPGKYIGVYTDNTVADSTEVSTYTWSLIKGADGEDGIGITSIVEEYYLSTSSAAQTGGSWSTSQPDYVDGRYYWTRSKVTWDDGEVTYTAPQLAQGINNANETAKAAADAVVSLDEALDQEEVLNRLTKGDTEQGIYLEDGKLYINGTYIKSGVVDASLLKAGKLLVTDKDTGKTIFYADIDNGAVYIGGDNVQIGGSSLTDELDSISSDVTAASAKYGYCYTSAATAAKTVEISGFKLVKGATVCVKFSSANSASSPTLDVSSTGAKKIVYNGYSYLLEKYYWKSGDLLTLTYDGSYWQVADSAARKNARTIWANDTTATTVTSGTVTFNANTFVCNANNFKVTAAGTVTAGNITATGSFTGGSTTSGYGMRLGTDGCLRGYRNGSETARIDPTASVYYIPTGETLYGLQLYGSQIIREVSPHISTVASSSTSSTSTQTVTGTGTFIYEIVNLGNGAIEWHYETLRFINGRLTTNLSSKS